MKRRRAISAASAQPLQVELADVDRARAYAHAATADNTRKAYGWAWDQFCKWCASRRIDVALADDAGVAVYLAWLAGKDYAPTTVRMAFSAIASRLGWTRGARPAACAQVLRGIFRTSSHKTGAKRALTANELDALLQHVGPAGPLAVRNRALLLVGWAGAFRRSELASLDVGDVSFTPEGMRIMVRRSKVDQEGAGFEKGILSSRTGSRCPVEALRAWLAFLPPTTEGEKGEGARSRPLFVAVGRWGHVQPYRITPRVVERLVHSACRGAGMPAGEFAGHSLRAGFVTEAALHAKSLDSIMRTTGHRSVAQVLRYVRHASIFTENAGEGLLD
jgi:integrase